MSAQKFIDAYNTIAQKFSFSIPKREIFALTKTFQNMPVIEVIELLKNDAADLRLSAVSILDWKARNKKTTELEKKASYQAYIDYHDRIDHWGMVDRAAPYVIGGYLFDKDRKPLYDLAKSKNPMERRTAIVSTYYFIRKNEIADTFKIAEMLVNDKNEHVQKAVGSWIREAGKKNESQLKSFLDKYAKTLPRITLRYAIEKFDTTTRLYYLNLGKEKRP